MENPLFMIKQLCRSLCQGPEIVLNGPEWWILLR
jgi:hypothetical protein